MPALRPVPFDPFSWRLPSGRLVEAVRPLVMGIVNATPDSFHAASRTAGEADAEAMARRLAAEGADIIDVGACSTRPGSDAPTEAEELRRLRLAIPAVRRGAPGVLVSVDTWRAAVAQAAVEELGADLVNDVSGGLLDPAMLPTVARLHAPYVAMHMRGTPATMQQLADYGPRGVTATVITELSHRLDAARQAGVADVVLDPGFGFAKNLMHNYRLLADLPWLREAFPGVPLLAGISRKSMLSAPLHTSAADTLAATTAANTLALMGGAALLRVHDPAAARQALQVVGLLAQAESQTDL